MSTLRCTADEAFSAYVTMMLFDSIGFELHAMDLQESNGRLGLGIYCTLDAEKALASGKEVLVAEFRPTSSQPTRSGATELLVLSNEAEATSCRWRQRGFSGVLYEATEMCLRVDCMHALYRREWRRHQEAWPELSRLMSRMQDAPLAIDNETVQTEAAWAKAVERLKRYGDQQVQSTRERLETAWLEQVEQGGMMGSCRIS
mmetsp:Transcript_90998/g.150690  ORF Transcript_90998/g.150690 Transcript_90998/m.150690 type:complete len:202 (+) Transcript_90998:70-675(+)